LKYYSRLAAIAGAICTAAALVLVGPARSDAATYDGTDPVSTGCGNSAITLDSKVVGPNGSATIQLRYSTSCRTTWAKLIGGNAGSPGDCAASYAIIHRNSDGLQYRATWTTADSGSIHTLQVNDANVTSYAQATVDYCFAGPYTARTGSF